MTSDAQSSAQKMDDRVHARIVAHGLASGMTSQEALRYAESSMNTLQASAMRLDLAGADVKRALLASRAGRLTEWLVARLASALHWMARRP